MEKGSLNTTHLELQLQMILAHAASVQYSAPPLFSDKYQEPQRSKYRTKRQSCPGGVGNFGFNSFNFMTFVLLTMNAVADVNNNINNNNNNNVDINYNTINQDSNSIVSNSENTNMVMAVILPVPGRRSIANINRSLSHHVSKRCSEKKKLSVLSMLSLEILEHSRAIAGETRGECEGLAVCRAVKAISQTFLSDSLNLSLLEAGLTPFISLLSCQDLFTMC